jgi:hypothetical protein
MLQWFEEAIGCCQQSLAIFRETGDQHGEGMTLTNLGIAYRSLRQPSRAAECWREAAAMRDAGDHEEAGRLEQLAAITQPEGRRRWGPAPRAVFLISTPSDGESRPAL